LATKLNPLRLKSTLDLEVEAIISEVNPEVTVVEETNRIEDVVKDVVKDAAAVKAEDKDADNSVGKDAAEETLEILMTIIIEK